MSGASLFLHLVPPNILNPIFYGGGLCQPASQSVRRLIEAPARAYRRAPSKSDQNLSAPNSSGGRNNVDGRVTRGRRSSDRFDQARDMFLSAFQLQ